jgi:hypothetical protein
MGVHHQVSWLNAGSSNFKLLKKKIIFFQAALSWMEDAWLFARNSFINLLKKFFFFMTVNECGSIAEFHN